MANKGKRMVTIELDIELVDRLDKLSDKCGISRHQLMKNFVESCTFEGEFLSRIGMIYTAKKMMSFMEKGRMAIEQESNQVELF